MFKFNFNTEEVSKDISVPTEEKWVNSKQISPNSLLINQFLNHKHIEFITIEIKDVSIRYIKPKTMLEVLKDANLKSEILQADTNHSDLITGVYEGGLKVWECTYDLAHFICDNQMDFKEKKVLDLGCGMGIIGILTLLHGASVDFQDYNSDVINYITTLNMYLNTELSKEMREKCRFFSGDWSYFCENLSNDPNNVKYDCIFTSETIYNTDNYVKLINVFNRCLKNDGVIYLAAKSYYFGVGGGLKQFEDVLINDGNWEIKTVFKLTEGVTRSILQINRRCLQNK
nr:histidine protein methyltransferase 1 homolog [Onthophagus taurus]